MNSIFQEYLYENIYIVSVCSIKVLHVWLNLLLLVVVVVVVVSSSSSSLLSPLCRVFTIIYLKQTMFLGFIVLQLFCIYNLCHM